MSGYLSGRDWSGIELKVLSVDQSLANSGWALIHFGASVPGVLDCGTIHSRPIPDLSGYADSLTRGEHLFGAYRALIMDTSPTLIVHEAPAMQGKMVSRNREAPVIAVTALRCAAASLGHRGAIAMMQAQRVKKLVTGRHDADKAMVREAVESVLSFPGRINEHIADAAAIALAACIDGTLLSSFRLAQIGPEAVGIVR